MGAIKTLFTSLQNAPALSGVSVAYGEENINQYEAGPPLVVIVPKGGPWTDCGYAQGVDSDVNVVWMTTESIDIYVYGASTVDGAGPIDHADATEDLLTQVLQALQYQVATGSYAAPVGGAKFTPISGAWMLAGNEIERFGRGYVLTVQVDKSFKDYAPIDAPTPISSTLTLAVSHG